MNASLSIAPSELSLRRTTYAVGGLLLLVGVLPVAGPEIDSLISSVDPRATGDGHLHPFVLVGLGVAVMVLGSLRRFPRLARALVMLGALGGLAALLTTGSSLALAFASVIELEIALGAPLILLSVLLAALGEALSVWRKTSKPFATVALVGWSALALTYLVPSHGEVPIVGVLRALGGVDGPLHLALLLPDLGAFALSLAGVILAVRRLSAKPGEAISTRWRTSWAAVAIGSDAGLRVALTNLVFLEGHTDLLVDSLSDVCLVLAFGIGAPLGLAHAVLALHGERSATPASAPVSVHSAQA